MPSGKVHAAATLVTAGIGSALLLAQGGSLEAPAAFAAGCILGLVVNPDLDVRHAPTHSVAIMRREFGKFVAGLWYLFWWPYARLIPYHRHPLSHWPILGTALRLAYLLLPAGLLWWGLGALGQPLELPPGGGAAVWPALGGLALVDGLHAIMDGAWTTATRAWHRFWRRFRLV